MKRILLASTILALSTPTFGATIPYGSRLLLFTTAEPDFAAQTLEFYDGNWLPGSELYLSSGPFTSLDTYNATIRWQTGDVAWANFSGFTYSDPTHTATLNVTAPVNVALNWPTTGQLSLTGEGIMSLTGFDPTAGTWAFNVAFTQGAPNGWWAAAVFEAQPVAPVPLPAALPLFGSALLGMFYLGHRKRYQRRRK